MASELRQEARRRYPLCDVTLGGKPAKITGWSKTWLWVEQIDGDGDILQVSDCECLEVLLGGGEFEY